MKIRAGLVAALTAASALALTLQAPAVAATSKGRISGPVNYFYLGTGEEAVHGPLGTTIQAFQQACRADRVRVAAGQPPQFVSAMIASPLNGVDGFVVDLKAEKMGAFAVKGPGAKAAGPPIPVLDIQHTEYDMDLAFYADP
ncbi:MAG TPA: hypothetical protein VM347_07885, partial [Nonomuraea sp.]|nr:hypothetical protein [Nonomuraea sp.]